MAGKGLKNDKQKASILGSIAGAQHVRLMAKHYGIPVVIHSDHCAKKLLEWFDGMIEADEAYFKVNLRRGPGFESRRPQKKFFSPVFPLFFLKSLFFDMPRFGKK